jgi:hypothetical protein
MIREVEVAREATQTILREITARDEEQAAFLARFARTLGRLRDLAKNDLSVAYGSSEFEGLYHAVTALIASINASDQWVHDLFERHPPLLEEPAARQYFDCMDWLRRQPDRMLAKMDADPNYVDPYEPRPIVLDELGYERFVTAQKVKRKRPAAALSRLMRGPR